MAANSSTGSRMPGQALPTNVSVDSLLGHEIVDLEGRPIGELDDIVLDIASGRIAYVFIALNQRKYPDQRVVAPWNALFIEPETQRLRLNPHAEPTAPRAIEHTPAIYPRYATARLAND